MSLLMTITPPKKRRLKSCSDKKAYALAESDQPGLYLVNTLTGDEEVEIIAVRDNVYFSEDGRAFPKKQVAGFVYAKMMWVNDEHRLASAKKPT